MSNTWKSKKYKLKNMRDHIADYNVKHTMT